MFVDVKLMRFLELTVCLAGVVEAGIPRHAVVNETIRRALVSGGVATCCFGTGRCVS